MTTNEVTTREVIEADAPSLSSVRSSARIPEIDVIRGVAVMGILLVNMLGFSGPYFGSSFPELVADRWTGTLDRAALTFIHLVAEGKFLSMFSILFALSMVLQADQMEARGLDSKTLLRRRLWILLALGVLHAVFLSWGDILAQYAILGFLLLPFLRRSPRTLLIFSGISLVLLATLTFVVGRPPAWLLQSLSFRSLHVYAHGSFTAILGERLLDISFYYVGFFVSQAYLMFAMLLLGLWAAKKKFFAYAAIHPGWICKVCASAFGLGILMSCGYLGCTWFMDGREWMENLAALFMALSAPCLAIAYICALILLQQRPRWKRLLHPFASVGRMSLSNYVFQSVLCNLIFYSYGMGFYGRIRPSIGVVLSLVIVAAQVPLSVWWMRRFQFGPLEWLWRSLTYRKRLPLRISGLQSEGQRLDYGS